MAKRINFKSDVSSELRAYLQKEYNEYTAKTSMTEDEHKVLRKWIEEGNSPYSNPAFYADERGVEMDFISGWRTIDDDEKCFWALPTVKNSLAENAECTVANDILAFFMHWRSRASRLRRWLRFASGSESISRISGTRLKGSPKIQFRGFKDTTWRLQKCNSGSPQKCSENTTQGLLKCTVGARHYT